jgi:hypothetical protein
MAGRRPWVPERSETPRSAGGQQVATVKSPNPCEVHSQLGRDVVQPALPARHYVPQEGLFIIARSYFLSVHFTPFADIVKTFLRCNSFQGVWVVS